jgi:hypothetical protein
MATMSTRYIPAVIFFTTLVTTFAATPLIFQYQAEAQSKTQLATELGRAAAAPVALSGDNIYITWWTNNTANNNNEVMFRSSTDGGATFGDKISLSNTTNADSTRAEIDSDIDSVVVTWWETNQTSDTPVMRVSNDNGATFGPMLMLATNGTIGEAEETEEGE